MKVVTGHFRDGSSRVLLVVDEAFDVQAWLDRRRNAMQLLDVLRVEETIYSEAKED